jgi:hypothetical protein
LRYKAFLIFCIIFISTIFAEAHEGIFLKFSLGPGFMTEVSSINRSGLIIGAKNHAIGWCVNEKFALFFGEFGGLIKKKVGEYNYINLDAYGPGFIYYAPSNIHVSLSGGYSKAAFAHKWAEATGDVKGKGYGINMSVEKEWMASKRVGLGAGAQAFYIKTQNTDFEFINFSLKGMVTFYFTPVS